MDYTAQQVYQHYEEVQLRTSNKSLKQKQSLKRN